MSMAFSLALVVSDSDPPPVGEPSSLLEKGGEIGGGGGGAIGRVTSAEGEEGVGGRGAVRFLLDVEVITWVEVKSVRSSFSFILTPALLFAEIELLGGELSVVYPGVVDLGEVVLDLVTVGE